MHAHLSERAVPLSAAVLMLVATSDACNQMQKPESEQSADIADASFSPLDAFYIKQPNCC